MNISNRKNLSNSLELKQLELSKIFIMLELMHFKEMQIKWRFIGKYVAEMSKIMIKRCSL